MGKIRTVAVFAAVLALVLPTSARADGLGSIRGKVTDLTATPVEGACVDAYDQNSGLDWFAQTGPDGTYSLDALDNGSYVVSFTDCRPEPTLLTQWYNNKTSYDAADPVDVNDDAVGGIDAALAPGGFVTGAITDTTGAPASTCVSAFDDTYNNVAASYSGGDGLYRLGPLPVGDVKIVFAECYYGGLVGVPIKGSKRPAGASVTGIPPHPNNHGYVPEWYNDAPDFESATPVPSVASIETPHIDAALTPGAGITGKVRNAEGQSLPSICVDAVGSATSSYAATDDSGFFSLDALPAGSYKVGFFDCNDFTYETEWFDDKPDELAADPITLAEGEGVNGIDSVLAKRPRPDLAVTGLKVTEVPLRTDFATLPGIGTQRRVDVSVENIGNADIPSWWSIGATLDVWVQMRSDGSRKDLGHEEFGLAPGKTRRWSYDWNATGSIGDAEVWARLCVPDDSNRSNDAAMVRSYAVVGGTGYGFTPQMPSLSRGDLIDHVCYSGPVPRPA